jgi:hypothetical protein
MARREMGEGQEKRKEKKTKRFKFSRNETCFCASVYYMLIYVLFVQLAVYLKFLPLHHVPQDI